MPRLRILPPCLSRARYGFTFEPASKTLLKPVELSERWSVSLQILYYTEFLATCPTRPCKASHSPFAPPHSAMLPSASRPANNECAARCPRL